MPAIRLSAEDDPLSDEDIAALAERRYEVLDVTDTDRRTLGGLLNPHALDELRVDFAAAERVGVLAVGYL